MSDRLPPLADEVRAVLDAATPPDLPAGFEAKVLAKVSGTLTATAGGTTTAGTIAVSKVALMIGAVAALGVGAAAALLLQRTVPAPPLPSAPASANAPSPFVAAPEMPAAQPTPPEPVVRKPERAAAVGTRPVEPPKAEVEAPAPPAAVEVEQAPAKPPRDTTLAAERALLEIARAALAKNDNAAALKSVEEHERTFPDGRLVEERELLFVQALAKLGRKDEAHARARAFRTRFPESLLLPALDAIAQ
jgi:hypothetical protein